MLLATGLALYGSQRAGARVDVRDLIAFERTVDGPHIYVMNSDGTAQRRLAAGCCHEWSPDGRRIAFVNDGLYVINVDGTGLRRLVELAAPPTWRDLDWSPDGRKIAIAYGQGISIAKTDAEGSYRLTTGYDSSPRWSPNGRMLLFTRHIKGGIGDDVFVVNANGAKVRRLTHDFYLSAGESLSWSPDSTRVAVAGSAGGNDEIFVMNADGSNQRNITITPVIDEDAPSWSPRGPNIVFTSGRKLHGARAIHTIRPDGRRHRSLARGTQPAWSPDGRSIVFIKAKGAISDIYVMTASGRSVKQLTDSPRNHSPAWSPR